MNKLITFLIFAVSTCAWAENQEFKRFLDRMITAQQQEVKELEKLRDEFLKKETPKMEHDFVAIEQELRNDFNKFAAKLRGKSIPETPKVEVKDEKTAYDIKVEVPGMNNDDVKIGLQNNDLIIRGNRRSKEETKSEGKTSTEFTYGEFQRILHLNDKVDPRSMRVNFGDGIVNIYLKKMS